MLENEDSLFELDVPHRILLWGTWTISKDIQIGPGLEWRSGFPYTVLDEQYLPVGPRNRGGRFPNFLSFDLRVTKIVCFPFVERRQQLDERQVYLHAEYQRGPLCSWQSDH